MGFFFLGGVGILLVVTVCIAFATVDITIIISMPYLPNNGHLNRLSNLSVPSSTFLLVPTSFIFRQHPPKLILFSSYKYATVSKIFPKNKD